MSEKSQLISKLISSKKFRDAYTRSKLSINIPSQIHALRRRQELTQQRLAHLAEMKQSRISAMERPGTAKVNIETLIRLASAFGVGLIVKFVPFSEMLRWENEFSQDAFDVTKIENDMEFHDPNRVADAPALAEVITVPWNESESLRFFRTDDDDKVYQGYEIGGMSGLEYTSARTVQQVFEQEIVNA